MDVFFVEPKVLFGEFRGHTNSRSGEVGFDKIALVDREEGSGRTDDTSRRGVGSGGGMVGKADSMNSHISKEGAPFLSKRGVCFVPGEVTTEEHTL